MAKAKIIRKSGKHDFYFVKGEDERLYPFRTEKDITDNDIGKEVVGKTIEIFKHIIVGQDEYGEQIEFNSKLLEYKEIRSEAGGKPYQNLKFKVFVEI